MSPKGLSPTNQPADDDFGRTPYDDWDEDDDDEDDWDEDDDDEDDWDEDDDDEDDWDEDDEGYEAGATSGLKLNDSDDPYDRVEDENSQAFADHHYD